MKRIVIAALLSAVPFAASAQTPYAGMETRHIKTLSAEQIDDLRAGRGMGLALAAELNGYPGPKHVLELADSLALSAAQRASAETLFAQMKAETIPLGEKLIAQEAALNRLFAERAVKPASLATATQAIGDTQAALRAAHLKYHLSMLAVLTHDQVERYAQLRGYRGGDEPQQHHHHAN